MSLRFLDHVNVRTADLEALRRFYCDVLGLASGPRPPFPFPGAWLYCGDRAAVHLVERSDDYAEGSPRIEHFAFRAEGLAPFLARLRRLRVPYRVAVVPELDLRQVHVRDPDGNHVEISFAAEEVADLSPYDGTDERTAQATMTEP